MVPGAGNHSMMHPADTYPSILARTIHRTANAAAAPRDPCHAQQLELYHAIVCDSGCYGHISVVNAVSNASILARIH